MLTIIKIEADGQGRHDIQSQSHRTECWEEGYIAVPPRLEADVWACMGWCELVIEDGVLTGITPTERPPEPEQPPGHLCGPAEPDRGGHRHRRQAAAGLGAL